MRLYAEDPRTFLPQAGRIERLRLPAAIRVDAGVEEGDEVGTAYDPMIAKLIAHGADARRGARPARAPRSRETEVDGRDDEPAVPALARRAPGAARGRDDDRVPRRAPAALAAAAARCRRGLARRRSASTCPSPPPAPPPDVDGGRTRAGAGAEQSTITAPMPGTVIRVLVAAGDRSTRASRSSCSRR